MDVAGLDLESRPGFLPGPAEHFLRFETKALTRVSEKKGKVRARGQVGGTREFQFHKLGVFGVQRDFLLKQSKDLLMDAVLLPVIIAGIQLGL